MSAYPYPDDVRLVGYPNEHNHVQRVINLHFSINRPEDHTPELTMEEKWKNTLDSTKRSFHFCSQCRRLLHTSVIGSGGKCYSCS